MTNQKIVFLSKGEKLLHSFNGSVAVWNTQTDTLSYTCSGSLVGTAQTGETFRTTNGFWHTETGTKLDETKIDPKTYPLCQRVHVSEVEIKTDELLSYHIELVDSFGIRPRQRIHVADIGLTGGISIGNWAMGQNNQYIAVNFYINIMGHGLDQGKCFDLSTGQEIFDFSPGRISFIEEHNLLLVISSWSDFRGFTAYFLPDYQELIERRKHLPKVEYDFTVKRLCTTEEVREVKGITPFIVRINPTDRWMTAIVNDRRNKIFVRDMRRSSAKRTIKETTSVTTTIRDIAFYPDGNLLASVLSDGMIHIWSVRTGELIKTLVI